jgi:hypothetical protein
MVEEIAGKEIVLLSNYGDKGSRVLQDNRKVSGKRSVKPLSIPI